MISKSALGIAAAAGAGICFIGYCVYFDRKRRSDPNFKLKLQEKRRQSRNTCKTSARVTELPDLSKPDAKKDFFLQEVHLGEELLAGGDIEGGVEHLSYAVVVSPQPQRFIEVLQKTLPPQALAILLEKLPIAAQRISRSSPEGLSIPSTRPTTDAVLIEDDVE